MEMSKGAFAEHIKVSPGRVSQYISEGIISGDALVGEGRSARINVEMAVAQIAERRHPGQALGNGLKTQIDGAAPSPTAPAELPLKGAKTVAEQIQTERLEQERRRNRLAAIDEARANGELVAVSDFNRELGRVGQAIVAEFTGMAPDIANAIAAEFSLPQRDVLHIVKKVMVERRRKAAAKARAASADAPETREVTINAQ